MLQYTSTRRLLQPTSSRMCCGSVPRFGRCAHHLAAWKPPAGEVIQHYTHMVFAGLTRHIAPHDRDVIRLADQQTRCCPNSLKYNADRSALLSAFYNDRRQITISLLLWRRDVDVGAICRQGNVVILTS